MKHSNKLAVVVLVIGLTQMVGYLCGSKVLRGVGLASGFSPFPKVFSEVDGYEAFAASFALEGERGYGEKWRCELDPEVYSRIEGPYNRRNVYGATLAFAPRLPDDLRAVLVSRALAVGSSLREELGIPGDVIDLKIIVTPRDGGNEGPWVYGMDGELVEGRMEP
ncbi:MAG: hypothetical protein ACSHX7_02450 [Luteolibacter sp.]